MATNQVITATIILAMSGTITCDTGAPPYLVFIVQEYNDLILNCFIHYVKYIRI
ncbi:hypothetical protein CE91St65_28820 [[Clostridium] symbiosum]|nr:hypothetical protein CE91St65_28820 [[Clostridium] symbiosum]